MLLKSGQDLEKKGEKCDFHMMQRRDPIFPEWNWRYTTISMKINLLMLTPTLAMYVQETFLEMRDL